MPSLAKMLVLYNNNQIQNILLKKTFYEYKIVKRKSKIDL
jgi:hypothetical protein